MIDILAVMRDHDLYRERDRHNDLSCYCMTNYCDCDHSGFRQAYDLIAAILSDPSAKV